MSGQYDVIITGAGFAGIYAAWRLARSGAKVALVEASDKLGGILHSPEWNGYYIDNGTHNFDLRTPIGEDFYTDILQDNILIFDDQQWACTTRNTWTDGFEMPDFGEADPTLAAQALKELEVLEGKEASPPADDYLGYYRQTYGETLTQAITPMLMKYTGSDPDQFSIDANTALGMFSRPKLGTDAEMIALKERTPFWDARLGVSLMSGDERFSGKSVNKRFGYPAQQGLRGFCVSAKKRLEDMGVDLYLSTSVTDIRDQADSVVVTAGAHKLIGRKVFWSLPEVALAKTLKLDVDLMSMAVPIGTCFFIYEVPADSIAGPDYLHDYNMDRLPFRYNKAGVYSNQIKADGSTYVTAEVPCHPANIKSIATPENAVRAWDAMLETGYLKPGTNASAQHCWGHPVAFTIPKTGWRESYEQALTQFAQHSERIVGVEFGYRGRFNFMRFYETKLAEQLLT